MSDTLYLDAPSLVYRAFFALPKTITDPQGRPVNAVRGFMEMVTRLIIDRRPALVVAVFDADWRPAFRVRAYPGYKAERPDDPPELPRQFDVLAEVLDAAGIRRVESEGFEADDALATLVRIKPAGEIAWIVTGDRDLLALVRDPDVKVLFPVKGVGDLAEYDEAAVEARFGVRPDRYAEFAMLRGDPSDGLPGVAGIGPVRAAKLLAEYGSIPAIVEHAEALPPKQREAFVAAREYLATVREVVHLVDDAPLTATPGGAPDRERMESLAVEHGLGASAARLVQALTGER